MPIHAGHLALIRFARERCERLVVLVCTQKWETIAGSLRYDWARATLENLSDVEVAHCTEEIPYSDQGSLEISTHWGAFLKSRFPEVDVIFTSEAYGDEVASVMGIDHCQFDPGRKVVPVTATQIRANPFAHWDHIPPAVRPHFVRRICVFGPEAVGKSTLTQELAIHFKTTFVPEVARSLIPDSNTCTFADMKRVASAHAGEIIRCLPTANKLLFCDTDLMTTKIYSKFLFGDVPDFEPWIEEANQFDLYLLLESDAPYIQDGTRLGRWAQAPLRSAFHHALVTSGQQFEMISGDYQQRTRHAIDAVHTHFPDV